MRILGIDYGDTRVGTAITDELGITAQGLETIINNGNDKSVLSRLDEIMEKYKISTIVVGMPLNMDGSKSERIEKTEIICYDGYCPVHHNLTVEEVIKQKNLHPEAKVLVHPECTAGVLKTADYIGSTTGIMNYVKNSGEKSFIIVTEIGVTERLKRDSVKDASSVFQR